MLHISHEQKLSRQAWFRCVVRGGQIAPQVDNHHAFLPALEGPLVTAMLFYVLQIAFFISCNKNLISQLNDLCICVSFVLCCFIAAMESRIGEVRKVHVVYFLIQGGQVKHLHLIKVQLVALNDLRLRGQ